MLHCATFPAKSAGTRVARLALTVGIKLVKTQFRMGASRQVVTTIPRATVTIGEVDDAARYARQAIVTKSDEGVECRLGLGHYLGQGLDALLVVTVFALQSFLCQPPAVLEHALRL